MTRFDRGPYLPKEGGWAINEGRAVERAIFCPDLRRTREADLSSYDRVYFGNEFCARLLPAPDELRALVRIAEESGKAVTLATPPLVEGDFVALGALLTVLDEIAPRAEVVANDWGAVRALGRDHLGHPIAAGRLLHRPTRDPAAPTAGAARLAHESHFAVPEMAELLFRLGVTRIESDVPVAPPRARPDAPLPVSLHTPFVALSTTRSCPLASFVSAPDAPPLPGAACNRECREARVTIRRSAGPPLVLAGNTLFYERTDEAGKGEVAGTVDRMVHAPWIPM